MTFFVFNVLNADSLKCVSINNQDCKIRPEITIINPCFILISLSAKAVVIQSMIHMLKYVFLTILKTQMSKYLI